MNLGIHSGLSMEEYLSLRALSSGVCHRILSDSPLHARLSSPWNERRDNSSSKVADIGSAAHKMLLEGTEDGIVCVDAEDWRKKASQEARDDAYANGKIPILLYKMDSIRAMVDAARNYVASSEIMGVFASGNAEVTMLWNEGETLCKARADWLTADRRICLSYKTTDGSANPDSWIRTQLPQYDMATVFYERGVLAACGVEQTTVIHLIQEQNFPFSCSLVGLDPAYHDLAEHRLERALALWASCVATDKWPAYPSRIAWAEPKAWQISEVETQDTDWQLGEQA